MGAVKSQLRFIELGKTGLKVSQLGLGTWQFGTKEWGWGLEFGERDAIAVVQKALDLGINFIDTAEIYGDGVSEEVVGKAIAGRREEVIVATKVAGWHASYKGVLKAAERSLRRLAVSCIDLYQLHWPNPAIPLGRTMKAMKKLLREGKVRHIGLSNFMKASLIEEALSHCDLVSNQVKYNLLERDAEKEVIPYCKAQGLTVIAYSPLAMGFLSGKYALRELLPKRVLRRNRIFSHAENFYAAVKVLRVLERIAEEKGRPVSQVALNWVMRDGSVMAIVGSKSVEQLEANAGATEWHLTEENLKAIEAMASRVALRGLHRVDTGLALLNGLSAISQRLFKAFR